MTVEAPRFDEWCVLELLGHRKLAGRVTEATIAGGAFLRLDIPDGDGAFATQFYAPGSVYCITPTTEEDARRWAAHRQPEPIARWELPPASAEEAEDRHFLATDDPEDSDGEDF